MSMVTITMQFIEKATLDSNYPVKIGSTYFPGTKQNKDSDSASARGRD
jgi:hypothetical protein